MISLLRGTTACGLILALTGIAWSGELIVEQKNARADDKNPGTLAAPFKTIQAAVDKAKAGDTVRVRAGVYRESVVIKHSGSHFRPVYWKYWADADPEYITLEAYNDEHVVLDGSQSIPAGKWKLAAGRKNTYVAPFVNKSSDNIVTMVFSGENMIMPSLAKNPDKNQPDTPMLPAMPGDGTADKGFYYDKARKELYVNLGGSVPGKDAEMAAAQLEHGVGCLPARPSFAFANWKSGGSTSTASSAATEASPWCRTISCTIADRASTAGRRPAT